jgi:hypothetical protein
LGPVYILPLKSRSSEPVAILGGGQNNGQYFHLLKDFTNYILAIMNGLTTIVDSNVAGKFGLSMIKMDGAGSTSGVMVIIPTDGVENVYTTHSNITLPIVVAIISFSRKIPIKKKVIMLGELTPSGQVLMGKNSNYKSFVAAISHRIEDCNTLILPISLKNNQVVQGHLSQLPSSVSIIYVANLGEVLQAVLDVNYI